MVPMGSSSRTSMRERHSSPCCGQCLQEFAAAWCHGAQHNMCPPRSATEASEKYVHGDSEITERARPAGRVAADRCGTGNGGDESPEDKCDSSAPFLVPHARL